MTLYDILPLVIPAAIVAAAFAAPYARSAAARMSRYR